MKGPSKIKHYKEPEEIKNVALEEFFFSLKNEKNRNEKNANLTLEIEARQRNIM